MTPSGFLHLRWPQARRVFLIAALVVVVYAALKHWGILERTVWNIPGFLMLAASMPWSLAWLDLPLETRTIVPPGIRMAVDLLAMAVGFGLNCAVVYMLASAVRYRARLTAASTPTRASTARAGDAGTLVCTPDTDIVPDQPPPDWWNKLSAEDRAALQRIMGESWRPSDKPENDVARAFAETRSRIREIEQRALKKLRGDDKNDK